MAPKADNKPSTSAEPWIWHEAQKWSPLEWAPLREALDRIKDHAGEYDLAGHDLRRHIFAEDLESAARFFHTEKWIVFKRAFWQDLSIWTYLSGAENPPHQRVLCVGGTLGGKPFRSDAHHGTGWNFFVRRAHLDKLYPLVTEAMAPVASAPPDPEQWLIPMREKFFRLPKKRRSRWVEETAFAQMKLDLGDNAPWDSWESLRRAMYSGRRKKICVERK